MITINPPLSPSKRQLVDIPSQEGISSTRRSVLCLLTALLATTLGVCAEAGTNATADARVHILAGAEYGYWAPEIRELYVRVPVQADPVGGDEPFAASGVTVDGVPVEYSFWYFDGATFDYEAIRQASRKKIEVFIPVAWRAGDKHEIGLRYTYAGKPGEQKQVIPAPATGGAWKESAGGNQAFRVREEAGLARHNEPVEFDVAMADTVFPDPENAVRATVMRSPGVFEEIPCQVYDVERSEPDHHFAQRASIRFRATVQLSVPAKSEALIHLWNCPGQKPAAGPAPVSLQGGARGGTVENAFYAIHLDPQSGQMLRWEDKRLKTTFAYIDARPVVKDSLTVMHRTPDLFRVGAPWSHALEWTNPATRVISGPLFCETIRWGPMPAAPEVQGRVTYRFLAGRPEMRMSSVLRVVQDVRVMAFRNGNMSFSPDLFTDVAWPRQDGSYVRLPIGKALGNDMGAPPPARFPVDTPWMVFYNRDTRIAMALITTKLAYFSEGADHPNQSRAHTYASLYRDDFLYTIRSLNQTYCAATRTYVVPMHAGTVAYEETAFFPFTFDAQDNRQFRAVEDLRREMLNPLVIVP